jgi:hypothetical protein
MRRRKAATTLLAVALFALAIVIRGSSGSRIALLPLFGAVLVFWFLHRGKRPRLLTALVLFVSAIIISSGIYYGREPAPGTDTVASYVNGFEKSATSVSAAVDPILQSADAAMAPGLSAAMTVIPSDIPYGYGRYLGRDMLFRWVPRQIWPSKPLPPGELVTAKVAPPAAGQRPYLIAYSILMHGYLDFGMFGAVLLLVYGILYRGLYEWFRRYERSEIAMVVFAIGLPLMVQAIRDGPVDNLFNVFAISLPVAAAWMASRSQARA